MRKTFYLILSLLFISSYSVVFAQALSESPANASALGSTKTKEKTEPKKTKKPEKSKKESKKEKSKKEKIIEASSTAKSAKSLSSDVFSATEPSFAPRGKRSFKGSLYWRFELGHHVMANFDSGGFPSQGFEYVGSPHFISNTIGVYVSEAVSLYVGLGLGGLFFTDSNHYYRGYEYDVAVYDGGGSDSDSDFDSDSDSDSDGGDSSYHENYEVRYYPRSPFPVYSLFGINVYLTPSLYSSISYVSYHDESSYPEGTPRFSDWGGFEISLGYEWPVVVGTNLYGLKKLYSLGFAIKYRRSFLLGHDDSNPNSRGSGSRRSIAQQQETLSILFTMSLR